MILDGTRSVSADDAEMSGGQKLFQTANFWWNKEDIYMVAY
jgi:hypothetical protein